MGNTRFARGLVPVLFLVCPLQISNPMNLRYFIKFRLCGFVIWFYPFAWRRQPYDVTVIGKRFGPVSWVRVRPSNLDAALLALILFTALAATIIVLLVEQIIKSFI